MSVGPLLGSAALFFALLLAVCTVFTVLFQEDRRTSWVLSAFFAFDLLLAILYLITADALGEGFRNLVNLDGEGNLPAWYSSLKLLFAGFLFLLLAKKRFDNRNDGAWVFLALALSFFILSLDEVAQIHEHIGDVSDRLLPGSTREGTVFSVTGIWMFLLVIPFSIMMLYAMSALKKYVHAPKAMTKLLVGMVVFLGSAGGLEILSNYTCGTYAALQVCAEEYGEMLGVSIILWAQFDLLAEHGVTIFLSERSP